MKPPATILFAIIIILHLLLSCSGPEPPQDLAKVKQRRQSLCNKLTRADREKSLLLSIKYDVPGGSINSLLIDQCIANLDRREMTEDTISKYAEKYKISPRTISAILIDNQAMEAHEKD